MTKQIPTHKPELKEWYAKNLPKKMKDASVASQAGNVTSMETALILARTYAERSSSMLDEVEVKRIEKEGYAKGLGKKLREALLAAQKGEVSSMEKAIEFVRGYAAKAQCVLDDNELHQIEVEGYKNGTELALQAALQSAEGGNVQAMEAMETALALASQFAEKSETPIDQTRVKEIKKKLKPKEGTFPC